MRVQKTLTATWVYEAEEYNIGHTGVYLTAGIVTAHPGLKRANAALQIVDDDGNVDRTMVVSKLGEPSKEMRDLMAEMFEPEPVEATPA